MDTLCFRNDHDNMSNNIQDDGKTKNFGHSSAKLHRSIIVVCGVLSLIFLILFQGTQGMAGLHHPLVQKICSEFQKGLKIKNN